MLIADLAVFDLSCFGFDQSPDSIPLILVIEQEDESWPATGESFQRLNRILMVRFELANVPMDSQFQPLNVSSAQGSFPP
jgi:hypothetical protein